MQDMISKLDLKEYVDSYETYLARSKPLFIEGDMHLHYKIIKELFNQPHIKQIPEVINLESSIALLQKKGVLSLEEIFAFVKIILYFKELKKEFLEGLLGEWMCKIIIPDGLLEICKYFDKNGELKDEIDERFEVCGFKFNEEEYIMPPYKVPDVDIDKSKVVVGLNTGTSKTWETRLWSERT